MFSPWLQSWSLRLEILLPAFLLAGSYLLGWSRLRAQSGLVTRTHAISLSVWSAIFYIVGLLSLLTALISPIDVLGQQLFTMHMIQHLLVVMVAPPLLLLANPFPCLLWGIPATARPLLVRFLRAKSPFRIGLRLITAPWLAIVYFIGCLWLWHWPSAYDAALRSEIVHDLEHLTFFGTAMIYWWHVTQAAPRVHKWLPYGTRIAYLLFTLPFSLILGLIIAFAENPIYVHYTTVPRLWGLSVMQDQRLGGVIMWVPGSMMYVVAAIVLVWLILQEENQSLQPGLSESGLGR